MSQSQPAIHQRQAARRLAMQALYAWKLAGQELPELLQQFEQDPDYGKTDKDYFVNLVRGVVTNLDKLDAYLQPQLDRPLKQIDPVELSILRLATFELEQHMEVPYKVVLNEAVSLTKKFGAVDAYKFVNGVLDKLVPTFRKLELSANQ